MFVNTGGVNTISPANELAGGLFATLPCHRAQVLCDREHGLRCLYVLKGAYQNN